jgi:formiminotetrahydrofolate cyclodeaminase
MKLTEMSVRAFLEALRSPAAVPGGGSSAALAGAAGACLLAMVAALPKHRAASDDEVSALRETGEACGRLGRDLEHLVDDDSEAYGRVMHAYRLPKGSEAETAARRAAIEAALRTATDLSLAVMRHAVEALAAAPVVGRLGNPHAASDVGVAVELLVAACRGAQLNVDINLAQVKDAGYADRAREDARALMARCEEAAAAHRAR